MSKTIACSRLTGKMELCRNCNGKLHMEIIEDDGDGFASKRIISDPTKEEIKKNYPRGNTDVQFFCNECGRKYDYEGNDITLFRKGDKVYDIIFKEYGIIEKEEFNEILVKFGVNLRSYTRGGYYNTDDKQPRLIFEHQVKDIIIPEAKRPFYIKDFLRKIPLSKEKSTFVIGFTSRFVFADIDLHSYGCYWSKDNCSKICDTLNRENVGYKDYLQAIKELIMEGVL